MYLADACALIAYFSTKTPERLMPVGTSIIAENMIGVLAITVWEITRKFAIGKLPSIWAPFPTLSALLTNEGFELVPFTWEDAELASQLPNYHRDPMDRMLIAAATRGNFTIITCDGAFAPYGVRTVW